MLLEAFDAKRAEYLAIENSLISRARTPVIEAHRYGRGDRGSYASCGRPRTLPFAKSTLVITGAQVIFRHCQRNLESSRPQHHRPATSSS